MAGVWRRGCRPGDGRLAGRNLSLEPYAARRIQCSGAVRHVRMAWRQAGIMELCVRRGKEIPVMEPRSRAGNRLLAALPSADFDLLAPYLRKMPLERDAVLVRSGDPIEQIYFPRSGTIAFIMDMPNGQTVATAVIGNEGAVGMLTALDSSLSPMTAVVRVAGTALHISPTRFQAALGRSRALRKAVQTHAWALWHNSSTSPPAMRCTRSRPAWPGGCSTSTIKPTATSCR